MSIGLARTYRKVARLARNAVIERSAKRPILAPNSFASDGRSPLSIFPPPGVSMNSGIRHLLSNHQPIGSRGGASSRKRGIFGRVERRKTSSRSLGMAETC